MPSPDHCGFIARLILFRFKSPYTDTHTRAKRTQHTHVEGRANRSHDFYREFSTETTRQICLVCFRFYLRYEYLPTWLIRLSLRGFLLYNNNKCTNLVISWKTSSLLLKNMNNCQFRVLPAVFLLFA